MKKYILIVLLLISSNVCLAGGPSFDCKKAKTCIEKFICADTDLSTLDKKMSETYTNLLAKLKGEDKEQIKQNQIRWIKARDERCAEPDMRNDDAQREVEKVYFENLFNFLYEERIEELQEWEKYADGKKTIAYPPWHPMCWKRKELVRRQFVPTTGNASVCRAFEEVLNTTCELPDKLQCNWTLPPNEKRFQKLNWQPLEFNEYKGVVEEIILGKDHKWSWNQKDPEAKKAFDEGRYDVKMAIVDIENSGKTRVIIHISRRKDCPARGTFAIINLKTKEVDWRYEGVLLKPNSSEGAEIMLYQGKTYKFGWAPGFKSLFIWDQGSGNLCEFQYLKGGDKK
jgi:uncharacterized protein YecT (DUF1311 family)